MKEKINQAVVDRALEKANTGKAPNLYSWFTKNATKQAKEEFKKFKPQNNQDLLNIMMNNSTDKQIINPNTVYLKHNRKHIFVFVNRQQDLYVVVDVDFSEEANDDSKEFEKIKKIMEHYGYEVEAGKDTVLFEKNTNRLDIDVTLEYEKEDVIDELSALKSKGDILENIVVFSEYPELKNNLITLCKDLMETRKDILLVDQKLNENNNHDELNQIDYCLNLDRTELYTEYQDDLRNAKDVTAEIGVICRYAGINDNEFYRLGEDFIDGLQEEKHNELINLANQGIDFGTFVNYYEDLFVFETLLSDICYEFDNILDSDEFKEKYPDGYESEI